MLLRKYSADSALYFLNSLLVYDIVGTPNNIPIFYDSRRATKLIPELKHDSYQERLFKLSLPSLTYRCQRGDMIFLYQLINQCFNVDITDLVKYQTYSTTRGHNYKIYKPHAQNVFVV